MNNWTAASQNSWRFNLFTCHCIKTAISMNYHDVYIKVSWPNDRAISFFWKSERRLRIHTWLTATHAFALALLYPPRMRSFSILSFYSIHMSTDSIENLDDSVVPSAPQGPVGNTKRQLDLSLPEAASTPSRKVTTPRRRCGAQTKTGSACKRVISNGSLRCNSHSRIEASYILDEY